MDYPNISPFFTPTEFDAVLLWAVEHGASDIKIITGQPIWARLHGEWFPIIKRTLQTAEVDGYVQKIPELGDAMLGQIKGGNDSDFAYEVSRSRFDRQRFRGNATSCPDRTSTGIDIVFRSIPSMPLHIDELDLETELKEALFPERGLILLTGTMGSGKTTTLSSVMRYSAENKRRSIYTYEDPIEFNLMELPDAIAPVVQCQIERHLPRFSLAPRNAARRAADIVLMGEARDEETLHRMIEMAELGTAVYATLHTSSVAETPSRIINVFPPEKQSNVTATMITALRVIVQQRLLPATQGGRVAAREFLVLTPDLRDHLVGVKPNRLISEMQRMTAEHGQPLLTSVQRLLEQGKISQETHRAIAAEVERTKKVKRGVERAA